MGFVPANLPATRATPVGRDDLEKLSIPAPGVVLVSGPRRPNQDQTGAAGPDPLETYANNSSAILVEGHRSRRYERRGLLWAESSLKRVRHCGRVPTGGAGVAVRLRGEVAGFAGVQSCGSVWSDPVCNAKIMSRRAVEIGAAVASWQGLGGRVAFATFTMRHFAGQSLAGLWDALSKGWAAVTSGRQWLAEKARHGIVGLLRVVEVTLGSNGWHVHIHALLFLSAKVTPVTLFDLHDSMFGRWSRSLVRQGLAAPLALGQDVHLVTGPADRALADYFTKATDSAHAVGLELTHSQGKRARSVHKTSTPWALLDRIQEGDADALDLWHAWETGSKGRRQLTWSVGLRDLLHLRAEKSDEDIAAEELGTNADDLVLIDSEGWAHLCQTPARLAELLTITQAAGLSGLRQALDAWDVSYSILGALEVAR